MISLKEEFYCHADAVIGMYIRSCKIKILHIVSSAGSKQPEDIAT